MRLARIIAILAVLMGLVSGQPGQIKVAEYTYRGAIQDMQWVGPSKKVVVFLTDEHEIHRSKDEGRTWESLGNVMRGMASPSAALDTQVKSIVVHEKRSDNVFLVSKGTVHYLSMDAAHTFQAFRTPGPVEEFMVHPNDPSKFMWTSYSPNCASVKGREFSNKNDRDDGKDSKGADSCYKALYLTLDRGATTFLLQKYIVQADWYRRLEGGNSDPKMEDGILVSINNKKEGDQRFGFWDPNVDLFLTTDHLLTSKSLVSGGNRFLFTKKFLFVAQVVMDASTEVKLQLSSDGCESFYSGTLPFRLTEHSYTVLDATEGIIFLHVNHAGDNAQYGHVYVSDSTGMNYSFSLRDNVRDANGKCDFDKVLSIEGVYMANYVQNINELEEYHDEMSQMAKSSRIRPPTPKQRSVISFDRGGEWALLRAPQTDSEGRMIPCSSSSCSLHLHGHTSTFAPMYSSTNAIGIIMGVGNVGPYLTDKQGDLNTYLSRDGGLTWMEVRKGSYIYELADHGGLIVMASDTIPTNKILYSWKQGLEWQEITFTANGVMDVDNIIVEPSAKSRILHVYGSRVSSTGDATGVIVTVDFEDLHERECRGATMPQSENSDYEVWSPRDTPNSPGGYGTACHLGHIIEYTRRKQSADCYNPNRFEAARFIRNCECTEADYECDFGFQRVTPKGPCVRDPAVVNETLGPPRTCPASGIYTISNGYRLVGGNTCQGGKNLGPTEYQCSRGFLGVSSSGWFVLFIILGLVGGMMYISSKNNSGGSHLPYDGLGTKTFGEETQNLWANIKQFFRNRGQRSYQAFGGGGAYGMNGMPETAMDFGDDDDFVEDGAGDFDFDGDLEEEDDDHDEAELISPTTTAARPLPPAPPSRNNAAVPIPKLNAPPTSAPLDLFAEDDDDDAGDAV